MDTLNVGENIRRIRLMKNLSQENVAEMLKISLLSYGDIERDKKDVTLSRLEGIAEVLKVDINTILNFHEKDIFNQNNNQTAYPAYEAKHEHKNESLVEHLQNEVKYLRTEVDRLLNLMGLNHGKNL